jgi:hypothetical protein
MRMKKTLFIILAVMLVLSFPFAAHAQITKDEYYARSLLSGDELEFYEMCYDALLDGDEKIYDINGLSDSRSKEIIRYVQGDCPELIRRAGIYTDAEAEELSAEAEKIAARIVSDVLEDATDYEKVKYAYDWVTQNITYGEGDTEQSKEEAQTIIGGLINREAVCGGISRTMQYILYQADVLSFEVTGDTGFGEDHGWLIVRIDGDWYWCDPTGHELYRYFLMDDGFLDTYAVTLDETNPPLPACTSDKYMQPEPTPMATVTPRPMATPTRTPAPVAVNVEPQEPPTSGGNYTGWIIAVGAAAIIAAAVWVRAAKKKRT